MGVCGGRGGRDRLAALLASSSVGALLIGAGTPALAACVNGTNGGVVVTNTSIPSYTNPSNQTGGCLVFNNVTVGGSVVNAGTITPGSPTGVLITSGSTINGSLSNTGHITITSGSGIRIDGSTIGGTIFNSGTISTNRGNGIRVFNNASVGGGIVNSATGTIHGQFCGISISVPTFSGGILNNGTISGGTGAIALTATSFSGGITNRGMISAAATGIEINVKTFSGGITNFGTISTANNAAISLFGATSFSGGISNFGTIAGETGIGVSGSAPVDVFNSGTIVGTGSGGSPVAVNLSGAGVGSTFTLGPGYNISGLVLGRNGDTLQLGGTGVGTFDLSKVSDVIAGGCSGSCPQYLGFNIFNVVSGTWIATGTYSGSETWTVNGGTLAGTGTLPGLAVNAGGAFAPGNPGTPGTFNVTGNLAMNAGATYVVTFNGANASKAIVGTATIDPGAHVMVASGSTINIGQTYTILTATSGVSGMFNSTVESSPLFRGTLSHDLDDVFVTFAFNQLSPLLPANSPTNVVNVATAIDNVLLGGATLPGGFQNLFNVTTAQIDGALSQLSGEAATGAQQSSYQLMTDFIELMMDPGTLGSSGYAPTAFAPAEESLPPKLALAYASVLKAPPPGPAAAGWNVWGSAYGGAGHLNGDAAVVGSHDVSTSAGGFAAGADRFVTPDTRVGFALAGGFTGWGLSGGLGGGHGDAFQAGVYSRTAFGPAYIAGALAFAEHWMTTDRFAMGDHLKADFNAQSVGARLEGGYRLPAPYTPYGVGVIPYAAIQVQRFHTPGFSETDLTGGGFGLTFTAQSSTDTRAELGSRFDKFVPLDSGALLVWRARLAWAHDWVSNPALTATFQALPGASFVVNGAAPPHDSALVTFGPEVMWRNGWSLMAKFDGEFASGEQLYAGTARLRYQW